MATNGPASGSIGRDAIAEGGRLRVGLIGGGSIARVIARELSERQPQVQLIGALVNDADRARAHGFTERVALITDLAAFLALRPTLVAECAGHGGLAQYGASLLR
ncbi:MAG: hypothetical protein H7125_12755, partial [Proteobacteria bacterium]|nr:hypothetical protein [Burkholderiales bacterium]